MFRLLNFNSISISISIMIYLPGPGKCLSVDFRIIFSLMMPDGCRASAHQKYIQSSRVRWFIMMMLGSLARIRSPDIVTLSPSSFSTSAYQHNMIITLYKWFYKLSCHTQTTRQSTLSTSHQPAIVMTLSASTSKLITSSKPFHTLDTFFLAPQIRHLLTLCAFINFIYLLTYCQHWHICKAAKWSWDVCKRK